MPLRAGSRRGTEKTKLLVLGGQGSIGDDQMGFIAGVWMSARSTETRSVARRVRSCTKVRAARRQEKGARRWSSVRPEVAGVTKLDSSVVDARGVQRDDGMRKRDQEDNVTLDAAQETFDASTRKKRAGREAIASHPKHYNSAGESGTPYAELDELEHVMDAINSISPDLVAYQIRLHNCLTRKDLHGVEECAKEMSKRGVKKDTRIYNILIEAHGVLGTLSQARATYAEMLQECVRPDVNTYETMMDLMSQNEQFPEVLQLDKQRRSFGVQLSTVSLLPLLNAVGRLKHGTRALYILRGMRKKAVIPDLNCYGSVLQQLAREGKMHSIKALLGEMKTYGKECPTSLLASITRTLKDSGHGLSSLQKFVKVSVKYVDISERVKLQV